MRKMLVVLCLLAAAAPAPAQTFPPVTEEGKKAAVELLLACEKAGAMKVGKDPRTGVEEIIVADQEKLKEAARQHCKQFTPAVRDALLQYHSHPGAVALLLHLGEEARDERAIAFGHFFSARLAKQRLGYREARQGYGPASTLFERLKLTDWQATSLNDLGLVCLAQGDLPQARKLFEQALALSKQLHGDRRPHVALSLNNLTAVCRAQGDLPQARKLQEEALALYKQLHGERHPDVAISLNNLAVVCLAQGDLPQARKLFEQALALCKQLHGERHPHVAASLNNLAVVCRDQGDLPQARKLQEQALELSRQIHGERHPDVATSLNNLATVCLAQGDLPQAVQHLTEAALACRLPGVGRNCLADLHPDDLTATADTVRLLDGLGWVLASADSKPGPGRLRLASHAYALAADFLDRLRTDVLQTEEGKLFQGAERAAVVPARVALAATLFGLEGKADDLHIAFTALEQGRARVFLQALAQARSRQIGGVSGTLLENERDLVAYLRGIDASIHKENAKTLDTRNANLAKQLYEQRLEKEAELNGVVQRMRQEHPQYAALQYPQPCTLQQARNCLHVNEVAVLFALDKKDSYALVVHKKPAPGDKGKGVAVVKLPGLDVLGPKVQTLVDADVLKSDSRTRRLGAELYDLLLKPLASHIQGKDLVIAPDGLLWELPFELLVEGQTPDSDGKYLIQTRQVRYTPSMTVLHLIGQWEKSRKQATEPLFALADPIFSKDDKRAKGEIHRETQMLLERYALRNRGGSSWDRLPGTRAEVDAITKLYKLDKDDILTDALASEAVVKTASDKGVLSRKRYIHLATHGILGVGLGKQPSLVLSLVGNDGKEQGGGVNDGFLTLEEVTHLRLNADLVVLSACETGKGELKASEGVIGLSRAFIYAGSRGVVCSLWHVDDEQTSRLMQTMYTHLKDKKSAAEALALARRKLIEEEQAPFYWAPFILIGK